VGEAYELINYLYRAEVAARNSDFLSYANGNLASRSWSTRKSSMTRTSIRTSDAQEAFVITARDPATQRVINRL